MPKARPLLQAALESELGPIADKVLKSGVARFSGEGYVLTVATGILSRHTFPLIEFYSQVHYDHVGARLAALTGDRRMRTKDFSLSFDHTRVLEQHAHKYGAPLWPKVPHTMPVMGEDYPALHVGLYRKILENDLLPFVEEHADLERYEALLNRPPFTNDFPYLRLVERAIRGVVARSLTAPGEWEALAETYAEALADWDPRVKAPYLEVLEAMRNGI